jgi:hypothetical protein
VLAGSPLGLVELNVFDASQQAPPTGLKSFKKIDGFTGSKFHDLPLTAAARLG